MYARYDEDLVYARYDEDLMHARYVNEDTGETKILMMYFIFSPFLFVCFVMLASYLIEGFKAGLESFWS